MTHLHSGNIEEFCDRNIRVWLDGTEMDGWFISEVNEEAGYLVFAIPGKEGEVFVDPRTDEIREVKLTGRVDITFDGADLSPEAEREIAKLFHRVEVKTPDAAA